MKEYYIFVRENIHSGWYLDATIWQNENDAVEAAYQIMADSDPLTISLAMSEDGSFPKLFRTLNQDKA